MLFRVFSPGARWRLVFEYGDGQDGGADRHRRADDAHQHHALRLRCRGKAEEAASAGSNRNAGRKPLVVNPPCLQDEGKEVGCSFWQPAPDADGDVTKGEWSSEGCITLPNPRPAGTVVAWRSGFRLCDQENVTDVLLAKSKVGLSLSFGAVRGRMVAWVHECMSAWLRAWVFFVCVFCYVCFVACVLLRVFCCV